MGQNNDTPKHRYENAACGLFSSGICRSCTLLGASPGTRIEAKQSAVLKTLKAAGIDPPPEIEPLLIPSSPWSSRTKIKMVVGGTVESPSIGITGPNLRCIELAACPLHSKQFQDLLEHLRSAITKFSLTPYDIESRRGELKGLIVLSNSSLSEGIVRFVLRSTEAIPRIRKTIPSLIDANPWIKVVSCNIQPLPAAILEGAQEVLLTEQSQISAQYGPVTLLFSPQSFMQVTPEIAGALYAKARSWIDELKPRRLLDLFCGVGGFSLSLAPVCESVTGIELSEAAIESAAISAKRMGLESKVRFIARDATAALRAMAVSQFDCVVVNPPRRGLSTELREDLAALNPDTILYSSCNPETFARDVAAWQGRFKLYRAALFDMFPLTEHCEVLGLLRKTENG